jgi:hypothetical protein
MKKMDCFGDGGSREVNIIKTVLGEMGCKHEAGFNQLRVGPVSSSRHLDRFKKEKKERKTTPFL